MDGCIDALMDAWIERFQFFPPISTSISIHSSVHINEPRFPFRTRWMCCLLHFVCCFVSEFCSDGQAKPGQASPDQFIQTLSLIDRELKKTGDAKTYTETETENHRDKGIEGRNDLPF